MRRLLFSDDDILDHPAHSYHFWLSLGRLQVLNKAEIKSRLFASGVETVAGSPEQLGAAVRADMARAGKLIRDAGIRAE